MDGRFGLLGEKLSHSYSPLIFTLMGFAGYELFAMPEEDIAGFLRGGTLRALNVTIPYKKTVLPFCDTLSDAARRLGNVNTLLFDESGRIHGHNTDYAGFLFMLRQGGILLAGRKVVILGSGGAAQTARLACIDAGARSVVLISRGGENHYGNLSLHEDAEVLVNATPVGMYPHDEGVAVSLDYFPRLEGVADMIYNPLRTNLLTAAAQRGLRTAGGLAMLAEQARQAAQLFFDREIPESETLRVCRELERRNENIVLVGMPGSGKTTVGALLALRLGREFVDLDALLLERTGRSAAMWIEESGEGAFREAESALLRETARERGLVIATGGGAVLREENRAALRRNGRVYWLRRELSALATDGRPLSRNLPELFAQRRALYEAASHVAIDVDAQAKAVAARIEEEFDAYTRAQWA